MKTTLKPNQFRIETKILMKFIGILNILLLVSQKKNLYPRYLTHIKYYKIVFYKVVSIQKRFKKGSRENLFNLLCNSRRERETSANKPRR